MRSLKGLISAHFSDAMRPIAVVHAFREEGLTINERRVTASH